jgi:diguanylate cyclase (GGDEF)-like protein
VWQTFIQLIEPQPIMLVGVLSCLLTFGLVAAQAVLLREFRFPLALFTVAMGLASLSLIGALTWYGLDVWQHTVVSVIPGSLSYLFVCTTLVVLSGFVVRRALFFAALAVLLGGYAVMSDAVMARQWNIVSQFVLSLLALLVCYQSVRRNKNPTDWLLVALAVVSLLGTAPRMLALISYWWQFGEPLPIDTASYRTRALVWALMPILLYASILAVINSRLAQQLRTMADHDPLTGAFNRRYLHAASHALFGPNAAGSSAVLMIDLDHFKQINDVYGHAAGDEVLRQTVNWIGKSMRDSDALVSRYGGEEFCVLVPRVNADQAHGIARRLCEGIAQQVFAFRGATIPVTVSIGVAMGQAQWGFETALNQADECLYQAKRQGRNQVVIFCMAPA